MSIHSNLRRLRRERGMTQEQVAGQVGITRQALSSYESGRTRPDIDMLLRLSQVYGTDLEGVVYGETQSLKAARRIRVIALAVIGLLAVLTLLSSALLWSAHTFFPLTEGQVENLEVVEAHFRLTDGWELVDGMVLTVSLLGFLILVLLDLGGKGVVSGREKLLFAAAAAAAVVLLPLPFALTDPVFSPVNYFFTPLFVLARLAFFLAVDAVALLIWRRRFRRPPER